MRAFSVALVLSVALGASCSSSSSNVAATGGAGGVGGSDAGDAGAGGEAGAPGDAGDADAAAPVPNICKLECKANDDCKSNGKDLGLTCSASGSCLSCSGNAECLRIMSGWLYPCSGDVDCANANLGSGYVCIDVDGVGRCAKAAPVSTAEKCQPPDAPDRMSRTRFGSSVNVDVCAHKSATCNSAGVCAFACSSDTFCSAYYPHTSKCGVSGRCECSGPADCAGSHLGPVCREGHCGCDQDGDCNTSGDAGTNGSKCVANVCSCTGVGECKFGKKELDGLSWVCEPADPISK